MKSRARLLKRIARAKRELRRLMRVRSVASQLGSKPDTPCLLAEDSKRARQLRSLVAKECMPRRPRGAVLCHRCDERLCFRPDHLFWGTQFDNVRDMHLKGRARRNSRAHAEHSDPRSYVEARIAEQVRLLSELCKQLMGT